VFQSVKMNSLPTDELNCTIIIIHYHGKYHSLYEFLMEVLATYPSEAINQSENWEYMVVKPT